MAQKAAGEPGEVAEKEYRLWPDDSWENAEQLARLFYDAYIAQGWRYVYLVHGVTHKKAT
jgi:hypothetical protein